MAVAYAERPACVPREVEWPDWVADRPAPGARIEAGAPVCTVLATAPMPEKVRALADERVAGALSLLQDADGAPARDLAVAASG
jgi:predicted ATP-grasp superfamily ATP-dependent carboligase